MKTPVAFIIFKRPDTTEKVFEAIRQAKPPKLLVIADGPRADHPGEAENCAATRAIIERVDWDCEVIKNYADENMGCGLRPATGISWVFEHVEEAIILEDDCLPHPTFFRFCEELLNYYRHDTRVMHISGNNFHISGENRNESYYFSRMAYSWGWATWKRAWRHFDFNISYWPELRDTTRLSNLLDSQIEAQTRIKIWDRVYAKQQMDAWDYSWNLTCLSQGSFNIIPNSNLISNIGFGGDSTHTNDQNSPVAALDSYEMQFPLVHPKFFIRDIDADRMYFRQMYSSTSKNKIINKFKRIKKLAFH